MCSICWSNCELAIDPDSICCLQGPKPLEWDTWQITFTLLYRSLQPLRLLGVVLMCILYSIGRVPSCGYSLAGFFCGVTYGIFRCVFPPEIYKMPSTAWLCALWKPAFQPGFLLVNTGWKVLFCFIFFPLPTVSPLLLILPCKCPSSLARTRNKFWNWLPVYVEAGEEAVIIGINYFFSHYYHFSLICDSTLYFKRCNLI